MARNTTKAMLMAGATVPGMHGRHASPSISSENAGVGVKMSFGLVIATRRPARCRRAPKTMRVGRTRQRERAEHRLPGANADVDEVAAPLHRIHWNTSATSAHTVVRPVAQRVRPSEDHDRVRRRSRRVVRPRLGRRAADEHARPPASAAAAFVVGRRVKEPQVARRHVERGARPRAVALCVAVGRRRRLTRVASEEDHLVRSPRRAGRVAVAAGGPRTALVAGKLVGFSHGVAAALGSRSRHTSDRITCCCPPPPPPPPRAPPPPRRPRDAPTTPTETPPASARQTRGTPAVITPAAAAEAAAACW